MITEASSLLGQLNEMVPINSSQPGAVPGSDCKEQLKLQGQAVDVAQLVPA